MCNPRQAITVPPSAWDTIDGTAEASPVSSFNYGTHTLRSTATDCQGNDSTFTQQLTLYNPASFSLTAPPDSTFGPNHCSPDDAEFEEEMPRIHANAPPEWTVLSSSSVLNNDATPVSGCQFKKTRDYTVTLIHANNHNTRDIHATRTYYYTNDTSGPTLETKNITVNLDASGTATIQPVDVISRLYDNCSDSINISVVSFSPSSFTCSNRGDNTITFEVTDVCGNHSSQTAVVTVVDAIAPAVTCPANITASCNAGSCLATVTPANPVSSDNCAIDSVYWVMSNAKVDASPKTDKQQFVGTYLFPVGTTRVTYTVKDQSNNAVTCYFDVTVNDSELPVATGLPANVAHIAWEQRLGYAFAIPTITDNCGTIASYTLSLNGGAPIDLLNPSNLMGASYTVNLNGEAPGDVNGNGVGVDNTVVFSWSDGVNPVQSYAWTIHVDYRPRVLTTARVNPICIGNSNGYIQLPPPTPVVNYHQIETRSSVVVEYSWDNITFTPTTAQLLPNLPAGNYYFRVSTDVNGFRSYSDTLVVTLVDPPLIQPTDPVSAITNEFCRGDHNGAIHLTVNYTDGVTNPFRSYTMTWTKDGAAYAPADPYNLASLDSSVYHLRITDSQGCFVDQTYAVIIDNNVLPTITDAPGMTIPDPEGLADGVASLDVDPGSCFYLVSGTGYDPTAADGTCSAVLTHNYTGTTGHPWNNPSTLNGAYLPVGRTEIVWTAVDASYNTVQRAYAITVTDNIAPSINNQPDVQYPYCDSIRRLPLPVVSDNCGIDSVKCNLTGNTNWWPNIQAGETETYTQYHFDPLVSTTVTWTVYDHNGLNSPDSYLVTFTTPIDTTTNFQVDPVQCKDSVDGHIHLEFAGGKPPYDITVGSVFSVTDDAATSYDINNLSLSNYSIRITDADGCIKQFDVVVTEPDPITAPLASPIVNNNCFDDTNGSVDLAVQGGNGGYNYSWSGPAYPYADGHPWHVPPTVVLPNSAVLSGLHTGRYSLIVTDSKSCQASFNYDVLSSDLSAPAYTVPSGPALTRNSDNGRCSYTVVGPELDPSAVSDNCEALVWHNLRPTTDSTTLAGMVLNQGTTTVTWKVYDRSGNGNTFPVTYRVTDSQPPQFVTPPATVNGFVLPNQCGYWIKTTSPSDTAMVVSDNCPWPANYLTYRRSDNSTLTLASPFDVKYPNADTIIWTLRDGAGNTAVHRQLVYVRDTIKPSITNCSDTLKVYLRSNPANSDYVLPVTRYENTISDNCGELDSIYANRADNPASRTFTCSDVGSYPRVDISARDIWGNTASCRRVVSVLDTVRPLVGTTPRTIYLNPNTATLNPSILNSGSLDNCDPTGLNLIYRLIYNGKVQPDSVFDCSQIGIHPVTLRVYDRLPGGNYRDVSVNVTVADTTPPSATLLATRPILYLNGAGQNVVNPSSLVSSVADNCDNLSQILLSANPSIVTCDSLGLTSVLLTMNDRWGNDRTIRVPVDVRDTIRPTVNLKDLTIRLGNGYASDTTLLGSQFDNGSFDNCHNLTFTVTPSTFDCDDIGEHTVSVTVSDGSTTPITRQANVTILTPVTINSIILNACNSSAFFSADVTPAPSPLTEYDWHWWATAQNNGVPNNHVFCSTAADADVGGQGGPSCNNFSYEPEPYFNSANNNELYIHLVVKPHNSTCWTDTFVYFLDVTQGSSTSNYIEENIDACVNDVETYTIEPLVGATAATWNITGNGTIVSSSVTPASNPTSATATVRWTTPTSGYSTTGYLQLTVQYPTGGGANGKKACNDVYRWYPFIHTAPDPAFVSSPPIATSVCPNDTVTYRLTHSYWVYDWKAIKAGKIIAGGNNNDSTITVVWNGALNSTDSVKVIVYNNNDCFDSVCSPKITIRDTDPPYFTSTASAFNRVMRNQTNRCDTILTGLPLPDATDICNTKACASCVTRTYTIADSTTGATLFTGDVTNFNARRLSVGSWRVTWVVKDAGNNQNATPFVYYIRVTDYQDPVFTTSPNVFYFDSDVDACSHTHSGTDLDLQATDNCGISSVWCVVDGNTLSTLNGYTFASSITPVTWYVRDVNGRTNSHIYTVNINDTNDPEFRFGTFPSDNATVNYEGTFAANTRFFVFEQSHNQSFPLSILAIITDHCEMGPVTVTLTFPDSTTQNYTIAPVQDSLFTLNATVPLGRTVIEWTYSDAAGNQLQLRHRVIFVSEYGFDCGVDETMWYGENRCNPLLADFNEGEASPAPPAWFNPLDVFWNALDYSFSYNVSLADPDGTECLVYRDKLYDAIYQINIVGNPTSQLSPDAGCTQTFEYIIDTLGPVINPVHKADLVLECGTYDPADITTWLNSFAGVDSSTDITDNCSSGGFLIGNNYTGLIGAGCSADSVTTVQFTVLDSCGNRSTYSASIRMRDTSKPWFTMGGNPITVADVPPVLTIDCAVAIPSYTIGVDDDCDPAPVVTYNATNNKTTNGSCTDNTYDISRSWTATDACGNDSVWTQLIHVVDSKSPVWLIDPLTLIRDTTVACGSVPPAPDIPNNWYQEDCDLSPHEFMRDVNHQGTDPALPGYYNYTIERYWSVSDNCNDTLEALQTITVQDILPPQVVTEASDATVQCEGVGVNTAYVAWLANHGGAIANDLCTPVNFLTWTDNDGSVSWSSACGNTRSKEITFTVTDPSGNSSVTTATFTYNDLVAPIYSGSWTPAGPYGPYDSIAVIPAAYTSVAEIEARGITITDGCAVDADLNVSVLIDTIYFAGCDFNLTRVYSVSDDCGNSVSLPMQTFTVRDGIKPVIQKALTSLSGCALDPVAQTTTVAGLALRATDITDNCSAGSFFITNANTRIQYQTVHPVSGVSPWTYGNPDELVFQEGTTEVWYKVTDANNNISDPKRLYNVTVLHMPVISPITTTEPTGITGGATNPLRYSTHRYSVTMAVLSNLMPTPVGNTGWKIYPTGNRTSPYSAVTDYSMAVSNVGNDITATITFNRNLPEGGTYDLVFVEQDVLGCYAEESFTFTLGAPFDVDVDDMADQCPEVSNTIIEVGNQVQPDGTGTTTTVNYTISMVSPTPGYQNNWHFDYEVTIGQYPAGANNASINAVSFTVLDGVAANITTPGTTSGTVNVTYNSANPTTQIRLTVVYNDIHATTQLAAVHLSSITGASGEIDLDTVLGTENDGIIGSDGSNENSTMHLINDLPLPGNLTGVE